MGGYYSSDLKNGYSNSMISPTRTSICGSTNYLVYDWTVVYSR